jgi:phosphate starvation-inducible PhoH-like protein
MDDHPLSSSPHQTGDDAAAGTDDAATDVSMASSNGHRGPDSRHTIVVPSDVPMVALLGPGDELLSTVERAFPRLDVHVRGNEWTVSGPSPEVALLERLVDELLAVIAAGQPLSRDAVDRSVSMLRQQTSERPADVLTLNILSNRGKKIRPKTLNQKRYVDAIDENTVVFGIGPAGTGKTYLAMAKAVQALQAKKVNRIILTRPAVEAGERLGFLPGTLTEKIDPYLRPLYDALHDMLDPDSIPRLMAAGTIEVAPLAYMRGRSLNDAFIILDEAQNTSAEQMKMFLTRLGFGSKIVVTGDVTQVDLPAGTQSGLRIVQEILDGIDDVHFAQLTSQDVVRHRLVGEIVDAYGRWDSLHADPSESGQGRPRDHRGESRTGRHPRSAEGRR